ncbi:SrmB Superfamily II DNA and RNA helicases [Burkholderiales bacterium]
MSFKELGLHPDILRAVVDAGYEIPTPIQEQAIPQVMAGHDVMGAAQTGTGKTAAFTLPILHRLMPHASTSVSPARHPVRALMLAPTRELADQIYQNVHQYATHTPLRSAVVFGGVDMNPQTAQLRAGVELLIATPGRLLDHVQQKSVNLSQVSILVLDEADRMLDMGFLPDLQRIVNLLPTNRQSLLFSATFSPEIRKLGKTFLKDNPVSIEVARRNATAENVTQEVFKLDRIEAKRAAVVQLVKDRALKQVIVFTNTKIGAGRLARELIREGIAADAIHGDKSQGDRLATLERFKRGEIEVLVATDVAARGLDIAELPAVINFDVPRAAEDYVHRIGRTGRAGASGQAISLMTADDERSVADIEALVGKSFVRGNLVLTAPVSHESSAGRSGREGARDSSSRGYGRDHGGGRGEGRGEGRSEARSEARYVPVRPAPPKAPSDPLFSQPYVEKPVDPNAPPAPPAKPAARGLGILGISRKPAEVPALLGGTRKPEKTT